MSDTAKPSTSKRGRCCLGIALLLVGGLGGYGYWVSTRILQPESLPFGPFKPTAMDKATLGTNRVISGIVAWASGDEATEVELDERQLNTWLFSERPQTQDEKARVRIEDDELVLELSVRKEGDEERRFYNLIARLDVDISPESTRLTVEPGSTLGDYTLDPVSRFWLGRRISSRFQQLRTEREGLQGLRAAYVENDRVKLFRVEPEDEERTEDEE